MVTTHLPDYVFIGAELGPSSVQITDEMIDRYRQAIDATDDDVPRTAFCPPTLLESYMSRLAGERFKMQGFGRFHKKTSLQYFRPIPIGTTVTLTGELIDVYSKGTVDYLVSRLQAVDQDGNRLLEMEVHHLVNYQGGLFEIQ